MKALIVAALASAAVVSGEGAIFAQGGPDMVPITRNYRGELACPSNYVIRGGACVSIYAGRRGYDDDRAYGHRRHRSYGDSYPRSRQAVPPRINYRGEQQCPSNYVIRGGACVSLY
jgi:hypothetical protein